VCRELEGGHDPEVAAATAQRPEQVAAVGAHDVTVGGDDLRGDQLVQRETVPSDLPADPAGQRQAADADALRVARRDRQAVRGKGGRNLAPGGAAADPHEVTVLVDDLHAREPAEVDHDAAVVRAEARERVAAAPHGQRKPGGGGEPDGRLHVGDARGSQHPRRAAGRQDRAAGRFVLRITRLDDVAGEGSEAHEVFLPCRKIVDDHEMPATRSV
jgi:hypothetical protein